MILDRLLGNNLVHSRYQRFLVTGSTLGVLSIVLVLVLFTNYYRAVERMLLGIQPHLAFFKEEGFTGNERRIVEGWLATHSDHVASSAFSIDLVVSAVVHSVNYYPVVCDDSHGVGSCFDFASAEGAETTEPREAVGFVTKSSRVSSLRIRGAELVNGRMVTDVPRVMDVQGVDLNRLSEGPDQNLPWSCLFERGLFPEATPLDDFLVRVPRDANDRPDTGYEHFRLLSTLNLGMRKGEHPLFVTSILGAQALLRRPGFVNIFEVQLKSPYMAVALARQFRKELAASGIGARSWEEEEEGAFRLLKVLRAVIFVVVFSLMVVAGLAIVSTLSLVVVENRRKIAMWRALGLRNRNLVRALIYKCWRIAAISLATGTVLGHLAVAGLLFVPTFRQGLAKMGISDPRVLIPVRDLGLLTLGTLILFFVVALIPARDACRVDVVEGLQS